MPMPSVSAAILGRKGKLARMTKAMRQLIIQPRRHYSRKPDEFYDRVTECVGPRKAVLGWISQANLWGVYPDEQVESR